MSIVLSIESLKLYFDLIIHSLKLGFGSNRTFTGVLLVRFGVLFCFVGSREA